VNCAFGKEPAARGQRECPATNVSRRQVVAKVNDLGLWCNTRYDAFQGADEPVVRAEIRG